MAVRWMPAHCTKEELCARGGSEEDWTGNDEADKRAKQEARQFAPPDWLVQARGRQLDKEGAAMRIISEIQCRVLSTRPRLRLADTAIKARKRRAPALPAALRRTKKARAGPAPGDMRVGGGFRNAPSLDAAPRGGGGWAGVGGRRSPA